MFYFYHLTHIRCWGRLIGQKLSGGWCWSRYCLWFYRKWHTIKIKWQTMIQMIPIWCTGGVCNSLGISEAPILILKHVSKCFSFLFLCFPSLQGSFITHTNLITSWATVCFGLVTHYPKPPETRASSLTSEAQKHKEKHNIVSVYI